MTFPILSTVNERHLPPRSPIGWRHVFTAVFHTSLLSLIAETLAMANCLTSPDLSKEMCGKPGEDCPANRWKIEAKVTSLTVERMGRVHSAVEQVSRRERGWKCSCLLATPYRDAIGHRDEDKGHDWWARVWAARRSERSVDKESRRIWTSGIEDTGMSREGTMG